MVLCYLDLFVFRFFDSITIVEYPSVLRKSCRRACPASKAGGVFHDHNLLIAGFFKEITMIDYGITNDTDKFVTEIQIPIHPK